MNKTLKRVAAGLAAVVIAAVAPVATAMAYGPVEGAEGRKYFDYNNTSTYPNYPAFNSFKNSPKWGFEPDFMSIKESTSSTWDSDDMITLTPGKTYDVVVFYHNNAPLNTNTAHNTRMEVSFPAVVKGGVNTKGTASISASNSTPRSVWSTLTFQSQYDTLIRYKQGSAFIKYSDGTTKTLPNEGKNLFTETGQLVGRNLDGEVAGCDTNSAFVQFQIVADQPNFTVSKQVRTINANGTKGTWTESITANPGDSVDYLITYTNTGTVQQNNVTVKDILPSYMTLVKGSTVIYNGDNTIAQGGAKGTDDITGIGLNIGNYNPGATAMVKFSAQIGSIDALKCGSNTLTNTGRVETDNGYKEDTAVVIVAGKTCPTTSAPTPVTELPKTGPASVVGAIVGAGAITIASSYYIVSRKKLN